MLFERYIKVALKLSVLHYRPMAEIIKVGVVTIDVSSIGIKFENFMQAGCRDHGLHSGRIVHCRKPVILPKLVL